MRRRTPCPAPSCQALRASRQPSTCSNISGLAASIARRPGRSKAIVSVGSAATHSAIAGSPVKVAMSPMNVPASASAIQTSLRGLRSMRSTRPLSITKKGASLRPCS